MYSEELIRALENSSPQEYENDSQDLEDAEASGLTVVYADLNTLQLDIDSIEDYAHYLKNTHRLIQLGYFKSTDELTLATEEWRSRNGKWHVQIHLRSNIETEERIMLQALLGSDRVREFCNLRRYRAGVPSNECIRLFRPGL
jgi:hypothetical protein